MWDYRGLWKYCDQEQIRDMLLSFRLLGDTDWPEEKILACLFAISNHPEAHYHQVRIPKKRGGYRTLDVPDSILKKVQRNILHHVLEGFSPSPAAAAYKKGGSPIGNAAAHRGKRVILKMDIRDFFGNITFPMVLHHAFPGSYFPTSVGTMLTCLCCFRERLPQGSPASPAVSNLVMRPFDENMTDWCGQREITYTRYSDDLTFSGDFDTAPVMGKTEGFLKAYGLEINREKTRVCTNGCQQKVTGIVVNEKIQLPRDYRRKLRQEIHYCRTYGVEAHLAGIGYGEETLTGGTQKENRRAARWGEENPTVEGQAGREPIQAEAYLASLLGKVSYLLAVNPEDQWFREAREFLLEEQKKRENNLRYHCQRT